MRMLLYFAVLAMAGLGGFALARNFVRRRLRFVDAIYSPAAPWIAGLGAALIAWPAAILPLPIFTTTTTALFGLGAGLGTASGVKALRRGTG